jgi:hypothetical protein
MLRLFMIVMIVAWSAASYAAESSSLKEHADVLEWAAKGLALFFLFEIWRNQRTLFIKSEKMAERVSKIEGYCKGRNCNEEEGSY